MRTPTPTAVSAISSRALFPSRHSFLPPLTMWGMWVQTGRPWRASHIKPESWGVTGTKRRAFTSVSKSKRASQLAYVSALRRWTHFKITQDLTQPFKNNCIIRNRSLYNHKFKIGFKKTFECPLIAHTKWFGCTFSHRKAFKIIYKTG